jgi:hypothetical protein
VRQAKRSCLLTPRLDAEGQRLDSTQLRLLGDTISPSAQFLSLNARVANILKIKIFNKSDKHRYRELFWGKKANISRCKASIYITVK